MKLVRILLLLLLLLLLHVFPLNIRHLELEVTTTRVHTFMTSALGWGRGPQKEDERTKGCVNLYGDRKT